MPATPQLAQLIRKPGMALVFLAGVTFSAYLPGLGGPFLFDDFPNLRMTQMDSLSWASILDASLSNDSGRLRRPISNLSLALNGYFLGDGPLGYKVVNLLIHIICGFLIYHIVRSVCLLAAPGQGRRATVAGVIAAAVWLLHPIQVSTVLYVVQRMAQLAALFSILAVLCWLKWRQSLIRDDDRPHTIWLAAAGFFTVAAVFSKENGVLVPLFLLAIELSIFSFPSTASHRRRWLAGNGLLIFAPLALGLVYTLVAWGQLTNGYVIRDFTLTDRLLTEIHAIWHYIRLIFFPSLIEMGLYRDDFPIQRHVNAQTVVLGLGLVAIIAAALVWRRRCPVFAFGTLWFFAGHALESTFLPLEPVFEHRNYLPLLGPVAIVGWYLPALTAKAGDLRKIAIVFCALVAFSLLALTAVRADSWSTNLKFLKTQMLHHPNSYRVHLGMLVAAINANNLDGAYHYADRIEENFPNQPIAPLIRVMIGCHAEAEPVSAIDATRERLQQHGADKRTIMAVKVLVDVNIKGKCPSVGPETLSELINELLSVPYLQDNNELRAIFLLLHARVSAKFGSLNVAEQLYIEAWRNDPSTLTPLYDLFYLHLALNNFEGAKKTLEKISRSIDGSFLRVGASNLRRLEQLYRDACAKHPACQE